MSLVQVILGDPRFGAKLLAGADAIDTRPECRTVYICDIPDPTPWLRGGELVLTTGILLEHSEEVQEQYVRRLDAMGCTALGYSGFKPGEVPLRMVKVAEEVGLPFFSIAYHVPLTEILTFAMARILDHVNEGLQSALTLQSEIMATVTSTAGLAEILQKTADALPDSALFVSDFGGNRLCELDRSGVLSQVDDATLDVLWRLPELSHGPVRSPAHVDLVSGHRATVWPICLQGELEAVFVRLSWTPLGKDHEVLLAQGVMGAAFVLSQLGSQRQVARTCVEMLVGALATSTSTNQVVSDRLSRLELPEAASHSVACLQAVGEAPESLCRRVEAALQGRARFRVGVWESRVYVIAGGEALNAHELYAALTTQNSLAWGPGRTSAKATVKVCASQIVTDINGLRAAFWQAHSAVSWDPRDSGVLEVTDLNVAAIFAASDPKVRSLVIDRILGPLLERDQLDHSHLLETLRCFLDHGCRPGRAASELFIHRHTLAYRLDRITELTGRDPRDGAHLLEFALAVALTGLDVRLPPE